MDINELLLAAGIERSEIGEKADQIVFDALNSYRSNRTAGTDRFFRITNDSIKLGKVELCEIDTGGTVIVNEMKHLAEILIPQTVPRWALKMFPIDKYSKQISESIQEGLKERVSLYSSKYPDKEICIIIAGNEIGLSIVDPIKKLESINLGFIINSFIEKHDDGQ